MTESQISALLDATYELEALLSLSQIRQGAPERIADLIRMKVDTIAALAYDDKPDAELPTLETGDISDTYSLEEEEESLPSPEREESGESLHPDSVEVPAVEGVQEADKETVDIVETAVQTEIPIEDEEEEQEKEEIIPPVAETPQIAPQDMETDISSLQRLFSLNDKFRFRRELFSGNDNEFRATLHQIAACDSLTDAEDYLYSDLQWDPDSDAVKAFIGVIANYFN